MKRLLSILLLVSILSLCVSCTADFRAAESDSDTGTDTTAPIEDNAPKHYEIDLTLENFSTFLTYSTEKKVGSTYSLPDYYHFISGELSFAYYENVSVTFEVSYTYYESYTSSAITSTGEYTIPLTAAGNAAFAAEDQDLLDALHVEGSYRVSTRTYTIKDVSGKVIFTA